MLFISENDVIENLSIAKTVEVVDQAYKDIAEGNLVNLPRSGFVLNENEDSYLMVGAWSKKAKYYGFKYAGSFPSNVPKKIPTVQSCIILCDAETGENVALIEANTLTALKTAASSAVATRYMALNKIHKMAIIGAGLQSYYQLIGALCVRDIEEIHIFDLSSENAEKLASKMEDYKAVCGKDYKVVVSESTKKACQNAQIITTITTSPKPVIQKEHVSPGVHLNAMGSFTPSMQEIDSEIVVAADRIAVDKFSDAWENAGDIITPFKEGKIEKGKVGYELPTIVSGEYHGRMNLEDFTIFESVGSGALDVAVAVEAYLAKKNK